MSFWLAAATCFALGALAFLVMRLRAEVRQCVRLVSRLADLPAPASGGDDHPRPESAEWPRDAALQAGVPAPPQLREVAGGGWMLVLLGTLPAEVQKMLPAGAAFRRLAARYQLVAVLAPSHGSAVPELETVALPASALAGVPVPAAAMVDPDGLVQGVGSVANDAELLAFVGEGEHHGFGPEPESSARL